MEDKVTEEILEEVIEEGKAEEELTEEQKELNRKADVFIRDRVLVYLQKNADYGDSFNSSMDTFGELAYKVRAMDKILRIQSLISKEQKVKDESIKDTVLDLFNYTVMAVAYDLDKKDLGSIIQIMYLLMNDNFKEFFAVLLDKELINETATKTIETIGNTLLSAIIG